MDIGYYTDVKQLLNGQYAAVVDYLFTAGLCVGINEDGTSHKTRYCYATRCQADIALKHWNGTGDPPGPWIKQKPEDRLNPERVKNSALST